MFQDPTHQLFTQHFSVTPDLIHRLGFSCTLQGHTGCVNCLQWNDAGTLLASGSDDFNVIIWDPFLRKNLHTIHTGHTNNVFSVKFLPETNDHVVVSGAGDGKIFAHHLQSTNDTKRVFACHFGRVKRLATCPAEPHLIWSASEDGLVMQFDCREPADCTTTCSHVLINLNAHLGPEAEVKCISLNSCRPELLAVGANDPFARVYDRRMLSMKKIQFPPLPSPSLFDLSVDGESYDFPMQSVKYYVAGHLPVKQPDFRRRYRPLTSTYLTFSPCGNDLLVNLGGEQIYLFDVNSYRRSVIFDLRQCFGSRTLDSQGNGETSKTCTNGTVANGFPFSAVSFDGFLNHSNQDALWKRSKTRSSESLAVVTEMLKQKANAAFEKKDYSLAVALYSQALNVSPSLPVLYANRAASYMKRNWDGDVYAALRDCCAALKLDSSYMKAFFRVARCLYELKYATESRNVLKIFSEKFPDFAGTRAFLNLQAELISAASQENENHDSKRQRSEDTNLGDIDSEEQDDSGSELSNHQRAISDQEVAFREMSSDYAVRFCGHCNTTTDIKEANFFGKYGEYVVAGSDDGQFFIWEKKTGNIVRILHGDESIVNCLQPHPSVCLLATSGIETAVKLWAPKAQDGANDPLIITDFDTATIANQRRMNADPLELMLMNIGYQMATRSNDDAESDTGGHSRVPAIQCRQI
ncbi:unnamed protein product [Soboliphyme baturini]|uniref:WD and tetratricopeptide repeats protein 1 n=1 Tax=Soboliphyme baturini TaxID=241478 RepID=A0A183IDD7_9BILA|nr:unnamed protein product [Soboliphyme baturini]